MMALALCTTLPVISQERIFLRVFNERGEKIGKGNTYSFTDSSIVFTKGVEVNEINFSKIWTIKTKRSIGSGAILGGMIGGLTVGILGAASACPDCIILSFTPVQGFLVGLFSGGLLSAGIGALITTLNSKNPISVNGKKESFLSAKKLLSGN